MRVVPVSTIPSIDALVVVEPTLYADAVKPQKPWLLSAAT
jgi:hypothetical protein